MKKFKKENRILAYSEESESFYLAEGYDVVEFNKDTKEYEIVENATGGKTYSIAEYNALLEENAELKEQLAECQKDTTKFDREETKNKLTELGIEFKGNASNDDLKALLEEYTKLED